MWARYEKWRTLCLWPMILSWIFPISANSAWNHWFCFEKFSNSAHSVLFVNSVLSCQFCKFLCTAQNTEFYKPIIADLSHAKSGTVGQFLSIILSFSGTCLIGQNLLWNMSKWVILSITMKWSVVSETGHL